MALRLHFPKATIDAVDVDAEALDLGQCFFGAQEDAHLLMHHEDGVKFLTRPGVAAKVSEQGTADLNCQMWQKFELKWRCTALSNAPMHHPNLWWRCAVMTGLHPCTTYC